MVYNFIHLQLANNLPYHFHLNERHYSVQYCLYEQRSLKTLIYNDRRVISVLHLFSFFIHLLVHLGCNFVLKKPVYTTQSNYSNYENVPL